MNTSMKDFKFDMQLFAAPTAKDLMIGAGKVYFRRNNPDGTKQARRHMGNCSDFKLAPNIEKIQKKSSMDAAKETYAEAVKSIDYKTTLVLDEFNPFNLALALYGDEGIEIQTSATVARELHEVTFGAVLSMPHKNITDVVIEPLTSTPSSIAPATSFAQVGTPGTGTIASSGNYTGKTSSKYYIEITKANSIIGIITDAEFTWRKGISVVPSTAVVMTGAKQTIAEGIEVTFAAGLSGQDFVTGEIYEIVVKPASSAYVEGVDYLIDATQLRGGIIPIPDTSNIPDGDKVFVSYTVPEKKYPKVMGGTAKKIEGDLLFIGDPTHGRPYTLEIWHVSLSPTGDIGLISEDWANFTLEMTVLADRVNHPTEPFFKALNVN